jgi:hypothetical protein
VFALPRSLPASSAQVNGIHGVVDIIAMEFPLASIAGLWNLSGLTMATAI